jgi:putative ABC transport system substrate-binding protein
MLELLKESVPRLSTVAIVSSGGIANTLFLKGTEPGARALGLKLIHQVVRQPEDLESAFVAFKKQPVNGLVSRLGPSFDAAQHKRFVELVVKHRMPAISADRDWVDAGGLIFYGADQNARQRRIATYIDKILKGTKPADLPVEAPMQFELVVNLKTAKQIGLKIPPEVLARANRIIR